MALFGVVDIAFAHHHHGDNANVSSAVSDNPAVAAVQTDPLATPALSSYLAGRKGQLTAAVYDLATGQEWILNPAYRFQAASIVKADILETLLHQNEGSAKALASVENSTAQGMIEASDNADASYLWDEVGGAAGVAAYNKLAGLTRTTPGGDGYWGETLTSAADQILLLEQLAMTSKLLTKAARNYQLYLMRHIDAGENWGVTGGVPANVSVALKNGWVPLSSYTDWEVNSIGWVKGAQRNYLVAVLTAHDPSESYGIATIKHVSTSAYGALRIVASSSAAHLTTSTSTTAATTIVTTTPSTTSTTTPSATATATSGATSSITPSATASSATN